MSNQSNLGLTLPNEIQEVQPTGAFNETLTVSHLVEHLKNDLKSIDLSQQKFKPSFIKFLLDKVKTIIKSSNTLKKEQLKDLSIQVLKLLITNLTDSDIKIIDDILDTLISNKLVKAVDNTMRGKIKSTFKKGLI